MLINRKSPHGGDIYTNKIKLDFSANINPCGMPDSVKNALIDTVNNCSAYPDPYCTALRQKLAEHEQVSVSSVVCGNGAAELIYQFAYSLPKCKPALIVAPTFSEYQAALTAAGILAEYYYLKRENDFMLTSSILNIDFARYSAVFICSPNNPTGITVGCSLLCKLADFCGMSGTRLFCDLCFLDLADNPSIYDTAHMTNLFPNVFILKAFTKSYGMAGVRLGYGICRDMNLLSTMADKVQCWNVSTLAQAAGSTALECSDWLTKCRIKIQSERKKLSDILIRLGITVFAGEANYLLMHSRIPLYDELRKREILVRNCSNYTGLEAGYIRIAVRSTEENTILLDNIREIVKTYEKS